jgi:hypothetical protein
LKGIFAGVDILANRADDPNHSCRRRSPRRPPQRRSPSALSMRRPRPCRS